MVRATAVDAAASAATLSLLQTAPRACDALLDELAARSRDAEPRLRAVVDSQASATEWRHLQALGWALVGVTHASYEAARWWCGNAGCQRGLCGSTGALRDATRSLAEAVDAVPSPRAADIALGIREYVSEGRRLARRDRASAIECGELSAVLARMSIVVAVERALASCDRAATAVRQIAW